MLPTHAPALTDNRMERGVAEEPHTIYVSYRYRLLPTKGQHRRLREALEHCRQLYNAALEERIDCYRKTGRGRSYFDQTKALTEYRQQSASPYSWMMEAAPLKALDLAYRAFFARGGFPRFKGREWFKSLAWNKMMGAYVRNGRFVAKGIGAIRIHMNRPLPSAVKSCRVKREGKHWYVSFAVPIACAAANDNPAVGVDVGLSILAALSTGEVIANPRHSRRGEREVRRRARALARCRRGSRRRQKVRARLASCRARERRSRDTYLHQVSADLTNRFGLIAVEKLNTKGLAAGMLARSVHDAAWGKLFQMLSYKAERAGGKLVQVDPRRTSQTCPECGAVKAKALSERVHSCPCGCVMDRDVAAAKVILHRAGSLVGEAPNVAGCGERVPGKAAA